MMPIQNSGGLPKVSICITSLNRAVMLEKTLRLLLAQDYPPGLIRLLLRDDGSTDGTVDVMRALAAEFLAKGFAGAEIFVNSGPPNLIAARNFLARKVGPFSDVMLVMDDDVYLEPDSLRRMAAYFLTLERCAALGPRVVFESLRGRSAATANFVNRLTGTYRETDPSEPVECDWLSSCCLLVNMDAWKSVGELCEAFVTMHEEPDFCLRARNAGFRVVYFPRVTVRHDVDTVMQRRSRFYYMYRNKAWFIRRNFSVPCRITALFVYLFLGLPKYLFESIAHNRRLAVAEISDILRGVRDGLLTHWDR